MFGLCDTTAQDTVGGVTAQRSTIRILRTSETTCDRSGVEERLDGTADNIRE